MRTLWSFAAWMICASVALSPPASAAPVTMDCLGDHDKGDGWESCWGVHYNSQGNIDCIGQWLNTDSTGAKCVGV